MPAAHFQFECFLERMVAVLSSKPTSKLDRPFLQHFSAVLFYSPQTAPNFATVAKEFSTGHEFAGFCSQSKASWTPIGLF